MHDRNALLSSWRKKRNVKAFALAVCMHWEIENNHHWILDVAFQEDISRVRLGEAPNNLAVLRHIALNLLRREHTTYLNVKAKRLKAAWSTDYLAQVLGQAH